MAWAWAHLVITADLQNATPSLGPVTAAIAVVIEAGKVLLVRRANSPDAGLWGFPGGKVEPGEGVRDAAVRELREETGIFAESLGVLTAVDVFERNGKGAGREDFLAGKLDRQFVLVAVLCRCLSGEAMPADDALDARWFDLDSVKDIGKESSRDVLFVLDIARRRVSEMSALPENPEW